MKCLKKLTSLLIPVKRTIHRRETKFFKFIRILSSIRILPIAIQPELETLNFSVFSVRTLVSLMIGCIPVMIFSALVIKNHQFYVDFFSASRQTFTCFDLTLTYIGIILLR